MSGTEPAHRKYFNLALMTLVKSVSQEIIPAVVEAHCWRHSTAGKTPTVAKLMTLDSSKLQEEMVRCSIFEGVGVHTSQAWTPS